jgi:hypothetical protein
VFVVHLVRLSNCAEIDVVGSRKPIETLMDEHIMNKKIGNTIEQDANSREEAPIEIGHRTIHNEQAAWNSENEKEGIVFFEKTTSRSMMIFMEIPHPTMHNKTMRAPGYAFH